jgi:hypothetical protein
MILYVATVSVVSATGCKQNQHNRNPNEGGGDPVARIKESLPAGWDCVPKTDDQRKFTKGWFPLDSTAVACLGPNRNPIRWVTQGKAHEERLARECLYLWIVPKDFEPRWPAFDMIGSTYPQQVVASERYKIFGYPWQECDQARLKEITASAEEVSSPDLSLSWPSWRSDLARVLK